MSTLLLRHWFKFNIALYDYVVSKTQHSKVLYVVVFDFQGFLIEMKNNFELLLSYSDFWNIPFIDSYFYSNKRMNLLKLKVTNDQLINKLSFINYKL